MRASGNNAGNLSLQSSLGALRLAGSSFATGIKAGYQHLTQDHTDREKVCLVRFGELEVRPKEDGPAATCPVLLLGYATGFQVWAVGEAKRELASRRGDGPPRHLEPVPLPLWEKDKASLLHEAAPCLAVVFGGPDGSEKDAGHSVHFYSLASGTYVHTLCFDSAVLGVRCSRRLVIVALAGQLLAYDAGTLQHTFSTLTFPMAGQPATLPLALGPRWLAYASNQAVSPSAGCAQPHSLAEANTGGLQGKGYGEAVQHYARLAARSGGNQLRTLGEAGYKYLSHQYDSWRAGSSPRSPHANAEHSMDDHVAGTVIVRDVVTRRVLAHFRAHTSPLLLIAFDDSGTLLVTASVHGHSVNVFHMRPKHPREGSSAVLHLYHLSRGVTPAVLQGIAFSRNGHLLSVTSARGTTHIFQLEPRSEEGDLPPHLAVAAQQLPPGVPHKPHSRIAGWRVRSGGLLNGGIPGSAAASAAVNLYNGASGVRPAAAMFQGVGREPEEEGVLEKLLVASSEGLLTCHRLRVNPQPIPSPSPTAHAASPPASPVVRDGRGEEAMIEPVQQWDVCRHTSWPEREEATLGEAAAEAAPRQSGGAEGEAHAWTAAAETSVPLPGRAPLWASSQFHILEVQATPLDAARPLQSQASGASSSASSPLQYEQTAVRRVNQGPRALLAPLIVAGAQTAVLRGPQPLGQNHTWPATTNELHAADSAVSACTSSPLPRTRGQQQ